jgi:hypothetical protein
VTGLKHRTVNDGTLNGMQDQLLWGKPQGKDLFTRTYLISKYVQTQRPVELWNYNRRMLTGPDAEVLAMD